MPGNPLASDVPCNCAVNQVCLRVGRFGEFRCLDRKFRYKFNAFSITPLTIMLCMHQYTVHSEGERCDRGCYSDDDDKDDGGMYAM